MYLLRALGLFRARLMASRVLLYRPGHAFLVPFWPFLFAPSFFSFSTLLFFGGGLCRAVFLTVSRRPRIGVPAAR